ncbi:MAG: GAF domain-containing protein [Rubrivivax sp.]|nr:GAF domain-containing protein [Rubrivivax sp.]
MAELNASDGPAFGQADLSNCDREPIHLAGSVQPHGALLLIDAERRIRQASANARSVLGQDASELIGQPLGTLDAALDHAVAELLPQLTEHPRPLRLRIGTRGFEGLAHRAPGGGVVIELSDVLRPSAVDLPDDERELLIAAAIRRFTAAASIGTLADAVVSCLRELTGHDRVLFYRFDADGHGSVIAEARDPRLSALLGHHYPASDIPRQARALYVRNRVRVLDDVDAVAAPLVPPLRPDSGQALDMSWCHLRTMSPVHLQYLRNMGVAASLSASLVRDGQLWGLVAMHHGTPRGVRLAMRAAVELLAEVASTRIAAIENYAHAQVSLLVRRLQQRLIDATTVEGDWRLALLRTPQTLLAPLEATGAALVHEGEILTTGEVPSTAELRELLQWVDAQPRPPLDDGAADVGGARDPVFSCSSVEGANPALAPLTPTACGVLAVSLSNRQADWLMWFRKEQLRTITWAGNPSKPVTLGPGDFSQLSPRTSFAAWSEIVRGTALPWSIADRVTGRAIGAALADIIVQVHAVRMLIAEAQLLQIRGTVQTANEPVLVTDAAGRLIFANAALRTLRGGGPEAAAGLPVADLFDDPAQVQQRLGGLERQPWRGEWALRREGQSALPVAVRAETVPGRDGRALGIIIAVTDLSNLKRTVAARRALEASLASVGTAVGGPADVVVAAIVANASLAAMDIAEAGVGPPVAPLLQELESSARRAAALYAQVRQLGRP